MLNERESIKERARRAEKVAQRAKERARVRKWDMNIVIFMFAILLMVIILLFEGFGTEVVAPIAFFGLAMCWLVGWKREKQLYEFFYDEELSKYEPDQE